MDGAHGRDGVEFDAPRVAVYDDEVSEYEIYDEAALIPFLDRFVAGPDFTVLDLACGTGAVTVHLVKRGFTVHAVDISPAMIEIATEKVSREEGGESVTFHLGSADDLPFRDGEFDLVTCQRALHHMPEIGPVFGEVDRVLKPGGSFYLSDIVADSTPLARALRSVWKRMLRFEASNAPACPSSQADVAGDGRELHRPATELTRGLAARGFACQLRFFTHVGLQRYLSTRQRARVIRVLSAPWKKRGDVLFVYARKAAQRTDELGTG